MSQRNRRTLETDIFLEEPPTVELPSRSRLTPHTPGSAFNALPSPSTASPRTTYSRSGKRSKIGVGVVDSPTSKSPTRQPRSTLGKSLVIPNSDDVQAGADIGDDDMELEDPTTPGNIGGRSGFADPDEDDEGDEEVGEVGRRQTKGRMSRRSERSNNNDGDLTVGDTTQGGISLRLDNDLNNDDDDDQDDFGINNDYGGDEGGGDDMDVDVDVDVDVRGNGDGDVDVDVDVDVDMEQAAINEEEEEEEEEIEERVEDGGSRGSKKRGPKGRKRGGMGVGDLEETHRIIGQGGKNKRDENGKVIKQRKRISQFGTSEYLTFL